MKNLKRVFALLLMMTFMCCLCACKDNGTTDTPGNSSETETESQSTSEKDTTVEDGKITYTVKLVDESGNPIANTYVQLCDDNSCYIPVSTNAEGIAEFRMNEGSYKAAVSVMPEGYQDVTGQYFEFDGDATEVTITLKAA